MHFPSSASSGNCIPFLDRIMGRNFPLERLWESVSHFERPEWDALSAKRLNGKLRPIPKANSGTHFSKAHPESPSHFGRIRARNHRPIRPPINKEASSRTAGHEVHREFRTQRRPLNVAFVLRRTVEQETLYPAPPVGDRTRTTTASCLDRRRRRTARFHLGRIYGERPPRSWRRYRCRQTRAAPSRGSPDDRAS